MAGVAGQRHGNATAAQQESDLLAAGVLLDEGGGGEQQAEDSERLTEASLLPAWSWAQQTLKTGAKEEQKRHHVVP